jgi:hypothetical protein
MNLSVSKAVCFSETKGDVDDNDSFRLEIFVVELPANGDLRGTGRGKRSPVLVLTGYNGELCSDNSKPSYSDTKALENQMYSLPRMGCEKELPLMQVRI